jgi:Domain of unknown function (DUF4234)
MAYGDVFHPAGTSRDIKVRGPVWVAVWSLVTLGIYGIFWYYYVNKELAGLGRARGTSERLGDNPTTSVLALIPGGFIIVPAVLSMYNTGERTSAAQEGAGIMDGINSAIACIALLIFFPVGIFYVQTELNKVWERETEGGAAALPGGGGEAVPGTEQAGQPAQQPPQQPGG